MGNYERFLNTDLTRINYMTTGRVYQEVIKRERNLEYKGKNVEVVPDIPKEVIRRIKKAATESDADVALIEIGGTIGEYQNVIFVEAGRMLKSQQPGDVAFVMVSYLPIPSKVGEMKTKPTQTAARMLNSVGVQADIIIARADEPLDKKRKEKIATFCNIKADHVISAPDVESIYDVPVNFEKDGFGNILCDVLSLKPKKNKSDLTKWKNFVRKSKNGNKEVHIAVVGKYFDSGDYVLSDVYISVLEAIKYSAYKHNAKPKIHYINSKDIESGDMKVSELKKYDGILVPGGFGQTGIEGIIQVIKYAREQKIPYFGLCYGMQLLVLEFARNVANLADAHTAEIKPDAKNVVIDIMPEQKELMKNKEYGGTMRLGTYPAVLKKGTIARRAYGKMQVNERHRHRFEVNPEYIAHLSDAGLVFSGTSPDHRLMEIAELPQKEHPFFLATQFHPEFQARPLAPHPLFSAFIKASLENNKK